MKHLLFCLSLLFVIACSNDAKINTDFTQQNETDILAYIAANSLNAQRSESGLHYIINTAGQGAQPTANSDVTVAYKGYFLDGSVFDESNSEGISFNLQGVIRGWTEGIAYFREGGSGMLLIPSSLGYGNAGRGSIPGGAVLLFDINLISVN